MRKGRGTRLRREYETIIIGSGVIGCGIAYHLSEVQSGGILVIDKEFPLSGTSGSTHAWVWIHSKSPSWYAEFSMHSAKLYEHLQGKIGDFEFCRAGGMSLLFTEDEIKQAQKWAECQRKVGIEIEVLCRDEALAREPALSPDILGAMYSKADGNVNPMRLVDLYMRSSKKNGVTYEYYNPVTGIEKKQGSFIISTEKGTVSCKKLVLSAGIWTKQLGRMLGIHVPVESVRGQIIITEPLAPLLKHTLSFMRQTSNGEVLIGASKENAGFDRRSTLDVMIETAKMGVKMVPDLAKARIVRCFSGLRVMPADELPILGTVPGIEDLYIAVTHGGITLSPLVGTLMTELIRSGETSIPIERFNITRFA